MLFARLGNIAVTALGPDCLGQPGGPHRRKRRRGHVARGRRLSHRGGGVATEREAQCGTLHAICM